MNEEGDMLDHGDLPQDDGNDQQHGDIAGDNGIMEHGFVEAEASLDGFCSQIHAPGITQNNLNQMLLTQQQRRFEAAGGKYQSIALNAFAIRKTVDVKRLKHQLWD